MIWKYVDLFQSKQRVQNWMKRSQKHKIKSAADFCQ